jgi:two-component system sensor histidine kinase AlgZ
MQNEEDNREAFLPDFCSGPSVLVVVVGAELLAIVLTLVGGLYDDLSVARFARVSLFVQWVALASAGALCLLKDWLSALPRAWASTLVVAVAVVATFVFSMGWRLVLAWVLATTDPDYAVWDQRILVHVAIAAVITGVMMRYFYVQEQLKRQERAELNSRIQALQSRIRPHFLFNSMNIIASLIAVDPDTAEKVVEDMSRLFRASLKEAGHEVPLAEELDLCRRYIHIEQLRLGDRLQVEWHLEGLDQDQLTVPLLTLQPLLENAIYHGIQPLSGGGTVQVRGEVCDDMVRLSVSNALPDTHGQHGGNRMALDNIRHRLTALYGGRARVRSRELDDRYEAEIVYPLTRTNA